MSYREQYTEIETIGNGNYGNFYIGQCMLVNEKSTNKLFVSKTILTSGLPQSELLRSQQEAQLLNKLQHPHIVTYKTSFTEYNKFIIIMEYCQQGDLSKLIKKQSESNSYIPEQTVLNWFWQLINALEFIHSKNILHRDIKSSNIFLTRDGILKLGDFGISKILNSTCDVAQTMVGTPLYMSPELCQQNTYAKKSDIWALGCVFYEICALKPPFFSPNLLSLITKITKDEPEPIPGCYSSQVQELISSMLTKDSDLRVSSKELFNSEIFTEFSFNPMISVDYTGTRIAESILNPLELCNNENVTENTLGPDMVINPSDIEGSVDDSDIPQDERNNLVDDDENVVIHTSSTFGCTHWGEIEGKIEDKKKRAKQGVDPEMFEEMYQTVKLHRYQNTEEDIVKDS